MVLHQILGELGWRGGWQRAPPYEPYYPCKGLDPHLYGPGRALGVVGWGNMWDGASVSRLHRPSQVSLATFTCRCGTIDRVTQLYMTCG